jgi:16S rRNA (cytosine1402-N4)-methyltransferase
MEHISVLVNEVLAHLKPVPGGVYVDATVGHGGHARALLEREPGIGRLICIDQDSDAIARSGAELASFGSRVVFCNQSFTELKDILRQAGIPAIDGIMFDLGVSTGQLKDPSRGFSMYLEGPLDMRMNAGAALHARNLIEQLDTTELADTIYRYGEERFSRRIAAHIKARQADINTTADLALVVSEAIPARFHPRSIHPATKTFQALRIAVNNELQALETGLQAACDALKTAGRMCVISFHSLEDRIVKTMFKRWATGCVCPRDLPVCACGCTPRVSIVTPRAVKPGSAEISANARARSAKLRVAEKL